jgi:hypothetical protein
MGWDLGKTLGNIRNAAGNVVHGVAVDAAKVAEAFIQSAPIMDTFTPQADKIDNALQAFTAPKSPKTLEVGKLADKVTLTPGTPVSVIPAAGFHLTDKQTTASFAVHLDHAGDARLDLTAAGPGTDWGKKNAESATMSVYIDGKYQQDVVLWGGNKPSPYALGLGNLPAGDHTVTLRYASEKSRPGARGVTVSAGTATHITYATPQAQWAAENSPYIMGRHGGLQNTYTDTPLALMHRFEKLPDGSTKILYTCAYSNEDSGNGSNPALEQARWGRLTDLETLYSVTVDPQGKVLARTVEGIGHVWKDFAGKLDGTHGIIRTASDNNNATDDNRGVLRFQLPPDYEVTPSAPQEDIMRQNPRFFEAETKELQREGKIDPRGVGTSPAENQRDQTLGMFTAWGIGNQQKMADPRDYLYVQFKAQGASTDPFVVRVVLKDGKTSLAEDGHLSAAIARDGWSQTSVRLPPGTKVSDVARVEYVSKGSSHVEALGHTFMLDEAFQPLELPTPVRNDEPGS